MSSRDQHTTKYDPLIADTSVSAGDDFSLEDILVEFGSGREQDILQVEEKPASVPEAPEAEKAEPAEKEAAPRRSRKVLRFPGAASVAPVPAPEPEAEPEPEPEPPRPAPRPITLEEVVGSTVSAVMEEEREPLVQPKRSLFSRRKLEETESLYDTGAPAVEETAEPEEEIGPEPDLSHVAGVYRAEYYKRRNMLPAAMAMALVPIAVLVAETYGIIVPWWADSLRNQTLALLACLVLTALFTWPVFAECIHVLRRRRCTAEVLAVISAAVSLLDCIAALLVSSRSAAQPYAAISGMGLAFALWGMTGRSRGMYDTFHAAAMDDEPPYLVTETGKGTCKQRGAVKGFYTTAMRDDFAVLWQTALLPVVLVASFVFAGLSSLGQGRGGDFLLNWSAILAAGTTFALPLSWGLPFAKLARHLQKTGCAVAGWRGAERISSRRGMIVTDLDLFPPGTTQLNGVKLYGEEMAKAASYAAAMVKAADCGLERIFDNLRRSEGGREEKVIDFTFCEDGGCSGVIRGESVLLGTAAFMRRMAVRMPANLNLKTGIYLALDGELTAVFAVKYNAAETVDVALRIMKRSRAVPILAARDPNITPTLMKRKFYKNIKVIYPGLIERIALSEAEQDRGVPRALLLREGLLPYAETVVGSRRMCRAVRRSVMLSMLGSIAGTLLSFYMAFLGEYSLMTPVALLAFLLLWILPVLLMADWTGRY